jgi:2-polyprenyl-3-methyl-5-hydroxy-6-metoxy-1,4-benzoquinol methylase
MVLDEQYKELAQQYSGKQEDYYGADRREMLGFVPSDCHFVLDVGCSSGAFGSSLKRERPDIVVWGIEPNADACDRASKCLDRTICGTFGTEMTELSGMNFDCIVFNDVLEHLVNPEGALIAAKDYLRQDGTIVASIPNVLYFPAIYSVIKNQDWKYEESGIFDYTHLRFFTRKSIQRLFTSSGFHIVNIEGINVYSYWKFDLINKLLGNRFRDSKFVQFAVVASLEP